MKPSEPGRAPSAVPDARLRAFSKSLPMLLLRAHQAVMGQFRPLLRAHGVTEQQWRVLRALAEHAPMRANRLAEATLISGPSLTRIIRSLDRRGLIRRSSDRSDLRAASIAVTDAGRALIEEVGPHSEARYAAIAERLGSDSIGELYRLLADIDARLGVPPDASIDASTDASTDTAPDGRPARARAAPRT